MERSDHLGQSFALPNRSRAKTGPIGSADFTYWKSRFGQHAGSGSGSLTAVPEPATVWLLVVGILTVCTRRRPKVS
jgi:PEP-CTERM motif